MASSPILSTNEEIEKIEKYIEKYVTRVPGKSDNIYIMGGTAKAALRIYSHIKGTQNVEFIETKDLTNIIEFIKEAQEDFVKNALASRYDNIVCGIMVMKEIAKNFDAKRFYVLPCGVREGYLFMNNIK